MAKFIHKPTLINIERIQSPRILSTRDGLITAEIGDWLQTHDDKTYTVIKDEVIQANYDPIDREGMIMYSLTPTKMQAAAVNAQIERDHAEIYGE